MPDKGQAVERQGIRMDYFNLKFHNTSVRNEIFAGIAMFMAMSYVLVVCPTVLSQTGMSYTGVFLATVCVAGLTTIVSAFYTKLPIALAPGLGMTSMFLNLATGKDALSWNYLLLATYVSGVLICALVRFGIYDKIMEIMDEEFRRMIMCGVGLALLLYGISTTGLLEKHAGYYRLGHLAIAPVGICLISLLVILLSKRENKKGFVLFGLLAAYFLSLALHYYEAYQSSGVLLADYLQEVFQFSYKVSDITEVMFAFPDVVELVTDRELLLLFINAVLVFTMGHFFDAVGTNTSCFDAINSSIDWRLKDTVSLKRAISVDGIGNIMSGVMGTPSVTTYGESMVGIVCGGKTGMTALTAGCLFLLCFFFAPLFTSIETYVAAPALIYVGLHLLLRIRELHQKNKVKTVFAVGIILYLGLSFNIGYTVLYGLIVYTLIKLLVYKQKPVKGWWVMVVFAILHILVNIA